jgi:hypothetical protein
VAARLGRRPGDDVDAGGVVVEFVDALPLRVLLAEDEDAAVVAAAGEDGAVFGVGPGDAPDGAVVAGNLLVGLFVWLGVWWRGWVPFEGF